MSDLIKQIESNLFGRQGKAVTNFSQQSVRIVSFGRKNAPFPFCIPLGMQLVKSLETI